jgi:ribonuclease HII
LSAGRPGSRLAGASPTPAGGRRPGREADGGSAAAASGPVPPLRGDDPRAGWERRLLLERRLWGRGLARVAGVDEAGRGPLAGPVVAAAVVLAPDAYIPGLDDSKRLTPRQRRALVEPIRRQSLAWSVAVVDAEVIDAINIAQATFLAMRRALEGLGCPVDHVLVDGFPIPGCPYPQQGVVGGDGLSNSVAAASVLAKVHRDALMEEYDRMYPGYGFAQHKGYPTEEHREALRRLGPCPLHRRSFQLDWPAGGRR